MTLVSWPRKLETWYISLGKQQKLGSILTTWTGKKVSPWGGHGSLSFKPKRNERNFSVRTTYSLFSQLSSTLVLLGLPSPHASSFDSLVAALKWALSFSASFGTDMTPPHPVLPVVALREAPFYCCFLLAWMGFYPLLYSPSSMCVHLQVPLTSLWRWR